MKILHTADWHIGQLFHQYDRTYEHQQFLNWLEDTLCEQTIDVLLISGDVFDHPNPSASSMRMFYRFLKNAIHKCPHLQIIVTAGNHDSAQRLETPKPLLESSNIHIIGMIKRRDDGQIDYSALTIPLRNRTGYIQAYCLAIPFLRIGDYPERENAQNAYVEGVSGFYQEAFEYVKKIKEEHHAIIAMGHLHAHQAEVSDIDAVERPIMGGVECISADVFDKEIAYVALGHIHKAQMIGKKEHIRYSGSPLPMSFTELHYKHQVVVFELEKAQATQIQSIEVPVSIPLLRIPQKHALLPDVLSALADVEAYKEDEHAPYLEVMVLMDEPNPGLRHIIETALQGKHVRLTKIDPKNTKPHGEKEYDQQVEFQTLADLSPTELLEKLYHDKYDNTINEDLKYLFHQVIDEVHQQEDQS